MKDAALNWLYTELKRARISLGRAEYKPGETEVEKASLRAKMDMLEWVAAIVLKYGGAEE